MHQNVFNKINSISRETNIKACDVSRTLQRCPKKGLFRFIWTATMRMQSSAASSGFIRTRLNKIFVTFQTEKIYVLLCFNIAFPYFLAPVQTPRWADIQAHTVFLIWSFQDIVMCQQYFIDFIHKKYTHNFYLRTFILLSFRNFN